MSLRVPPLLSAGCETKCNVQEDLTPSLLDTETPPALATQQRTATVQRAKETLRVPVFFLFP